MVTQVIRNQYNEIQVGNFCQFGVRKSSVPNISCDDARSFADFEYKSLNLIKVKINDLNFEFIPYEDDIEQILYENNIAIAIHFGDNRLGFYNIDNNNTYRVVMYKTGTSALQELLYEYDSDQNPSLIETSEAFFFCLDYAPLS